MQYSSSTDNAIKNIGKWSAKLFGAKIYSFSSTNSSPSSKNQEEPPGKKKKKNYLNRRIVSSKKDNGTK